MKVKVSGTQTPVEEEIFLILRQDRATVKVYMQSPDGIDVVAPCIASFKQGIGGKLVMNRVASANAKYVQLDSLNKITDTGESY